MDNRKNIFTTKAIYDLPRTNGVFLDSVKQNIAFQKEHCPEYARILAREGFDPAILQSVDDLHKIPVIPTLFLKSHHLSAMDEAKLVIKATSSGTKGQKSRVGFDRKSLYYGVRMVLGTFRYHKLLSMLPTNYIVLGYEPGQHNAMGAAKTAYGVTWFAPPLHREYALKFENGAYCVNMEGIERALGRYARQRLPVRFVGFPSYLYFLVSELHKRGVKFNFNRHSRVMLGGGWKQFAGARVEKAELYALIGETLGIPEQNCREFFSAVEHPVAYCDCKNHHFHVPAYSRVIIRDVDTLAPVGFGQPGLLSFVTPLVGSMPLVSIMTDDIAVLHEGRACGCGIISPYFELLGRAGLAGIKTCAAGAAEALEGL